MLNIGDFHKGGMLFYNIDASHVWHPSCTKEVTHCIESAQKGDEIIAMKIYIKIKQVKRDLIKDHMVSIYRTFFNKLRNSIFYEMAKLETKQARGRLFNQD